MTHIDTMCFECREVNRNQTYNKNKNMNRNQTNNKIKIKKQSSLLAFSPPRLSPDHPVRSLGAPPPALPVVHHKLLGLSDAELEAIGATHICTPCCQMFYSHSQD